MVHFVARVPIWLMIIGVFTFNSTLGVAQEADRVPHWTEYKSDTFFGTPAPPGFTPPFLDPTGVDLSTRKLADGVYALLSSNRIADNSGFIVGDRGVLVIDSHVNAAMAGKIMSAVAGITNKRILYVVNTNYHGDHTFGNYAFPAETQVVAHVETARQMRNIEQSKEWMLAAVRGRREIYQDVELRMPDIIFDQHLTIDLGGVVVEIHHFGGRKYKWRHGCLFAERQGSLDRQPRGGHSRPALVCGPAATLPGNRQGFQRFTCC